MNAIETLVGDLTVGELALRTGRSVEDIVKFAVGGQAVRPPGEPPPRASATSSSRPRSQPARGPNKYERAAAYTAAVRDAIAAAGSPVSGRDVRERVGGDATRFALAVRRLIAQGAVTHDGKPTSSRRYSSAKRPPR